LCLGVQSASVRFYFFLYVKGILGFKTLYLG
jgi:hypothetical protein